MSFMHRALRTKKRKKKTTLINLTGNHTLLEYFDEAGPLSTKKPNNRLGGKVIHIVTTEALKADQKPKAVHQRPTAITLEDFNTVSVPTQQDTSEQHKDVITIRGESFTDIVPNEAAKPALFSLSEFLEMLQAVEVDIGVQITGIEKSSAIRKSNSCMGKHDSSEQTKAQYGRILFGATQRLLSDILCVKADEIFLDFGHGIGNAVLQAAYVVGCEARGIEVVDDRMRVAETLLELLERDRKIIYEERDGRITKVGKVRIRHGRLEAPEHREFLSEPTKVVKALANNFNNVFGERSAKSIQKYYLDNYIAAIFALMAPDSVLVTLHPLDLGLSRKAANEQRKRHGLKSSKHASFFEFEEASLGPANEVVSWSAGGSKTDEIKCYKYTRVHQDTEKAVFLCVNPACERASSCKPIEAVAFVDIADERRAVLATCRCNYTAKSKRNRKDVSYK